MTDFAFCRIWLGGMYSEDNICFAEGHHMSGDSCNEIIGLSDRRVELTLWAQMAMGYTQFEKTLDMKRLTIYGTVLSHRSNDRCRIAMLSLCLQ